MCFVGLLSHTINISLQLFLKRLILPKMEGDFQGVGSRKFWSTVKRYFISFMLTKFILDHYSNRLK